MNASTRAILLLLLFFLVIAAIAIYASRFPEIGISENGGGGNPNGVGTGTGSRPIGPRPVPDEGDRPIPARPGRLVSGRVLDRLDRPASDAVVSLLTGRPRRPAVNLTDEEAKRRASVADLFQYFSGDETALHPLGMEMPRTSGDEEALLTAVTDRRGEFRFTDAPPGRIRLTARSGLRSSPEVSLSGDGPVDLVLSDAGDVRGTVYSEETGDPVEGAEVHALQGGRIRTSRTGAGGAYSLSGLANGEVTLLASHPGYAGAYQKYVVTSAASEEVPIRLSRGHRVTVLIRGFDPERPDQETLLPYSTVAAIRDADDGYLIGTTGSDGRAVFENVPPGIYLVNARRKGYLAAGTTECVVPSEEEIELTLDKAVPTIIRVVDERNYPTAGVSLWTGNNREMFEQGVSRMVGTTNRRGEFEFPFDWDGKEAILFARREGFGMRALAPADPTAGETIELMLSSGSRLTGRIVDRDGSAVPGASIFLEAKEGTHGETLSVHLTSGPDGRYSFAFLPPGSVYLRVEAVGYREGRTAFYASGRNQAYEKDVLLETR